MNNEDTKNWNVGGLYLKETGEGKKFFAGAVRLEDLQHAERDNSGRVRISIFKNDRKEKETQPDYNISARVPKGHGVEKKQEDRLPF